MTKMNLQVKHKIYESLTQTEQQIASIFTQVRKKLYTLNEQTVTIRAVISRIVIVRSATFNKNTETFMKTERHLY